MEALLPISPLQPSPSSSTFVTAPSSPRIHKTSSKGPDDVFPHAIFFSAPTSPARSSSSASFVPFSWKDEGETPKEDFEFEFSGQLDFARQSAFAEELFESGSWIRPLKPPPQVQNNGTVPAASTVSPRRQPEFSRGIVSPQNKITSTAKFRFNPVEAGAIEISRRDEEEEEGEEAPLIPCYNRGRERKAVPRDSAARREMRSLSPLRLSDVIFGNDIEDESMEVRDQDNKLETRATPYLARLMWVFCNGQGYGDRRWRLRDLLLFRSVSEGTGTRNLTSKKESITKHHDDLASSSHGWSQRRCTARDSFRSNEDSVGSMSSRRNRGRQSTVSRNDGVELHYMMNRAMSEEMKRKTFLPYRRGVLGCLGFAGGGGTVGCDLAQGSGSLTRGH